MSNTGVLTYALPDDVPVNLEDVYLPPYDMLRAGKVTEAFQMLVHNWNRVEVRRWIWVGSRGVGRRKRPLRAWRPTDQRRNGRSELSTSSFFSSVSKSNVQTMRRQRNFRSRHNNND